VALPATLRTAMLAQLMAMVVVMPELACTDGAADAAGGEPMAKLTRHTR
jgi:hypothetical protein